MISFDADVTLTGLTDNAHFIYAQMTFDKDPWLDGVLATSWELVSNTTGTPPSGSVCLARVVVAGGVAGTPVNAIHSPLTCHGSFAGVTSSTVVMFMGFRPSRVEVQWVVTHTYKSITYDPAFLMDEWTFIWDAITPLLYPTINGYATPIFVIKNYGFETGSSLTGITYRWHAIG
jgi:hypothetical protein